MFEAIEPIERDVTRGRKAFELDELKQIRIVHHLQIIGEPAAQLGRHFHNMHPVVP